MLYDEIRARIALHRHYSDQLMNHSRNLFAVAVSLFTGVVAYRYVIDFFPEYPSAVIKDWFLFLLIISVPSVSLYFFGRIYFYGELTRNVLAIKRAIGEGLREINLGVDWQGWFDRTALDEIDSANFMFFLLEHPSLICLLSGESYNIGAVLSTISFLSFLASFIYEWVARAPFLVLSASFIMFVFSLGLSAIFWLEQCRKVKSKVKGFVYVPSAIGQSGKPTFSATAADNGSQDPDRSCQHLLTITIYSDNAEPESGNFILVWNGIDYRKVTMDWII